MRIVLSTLIGLATTLTSLHRPHLDPAAGATGSPETSTAWRRLCDAPEPCHEPGHDHSGSEDTAGCLLCKISPPWVALPTIDRSAGNPVEARSTAPPRTARPVRPDNLLPSPRGPPELS